MLALLAYLSETAMASLTIRKLDDAIRDELRLRAARNGRSVEDEVRVILREAAQQDGPAPSRQPAMPAVAGHPQTSGEAALGLPRVTLIIGGGIAAYKALDLIRRLRGGIFRAAWWLPKAGRQFAPP